MLQGGTEPQNSGVFVSASIAQTGVLPTGDNSLEFKAWASPTTTFSVSINGNNLSLLNLGSGPNYTLYGADISAYAGSSGTLEFSANSQGAPSFLELDDITFSTASVPEPNLAVLASLGGLAFAVYRRFTKQR